MSQEAVMPINGSCPCLSPVGAAAVREEASCWVQTPSHHGQLGAGQTDSSIPTAWTLLCAVNSIPAIKLELTQR